MGILGITNRTENWKTAQCFAPFFDSALARARLVNYLLEPCAETHKIILEPIRIELFWKGMRDYMHTKKGVDKEVLADRYQCLFRDLHGEVKQFPKLKNKYELSNTEDSKKILYGNLRNTEIDIVLETPKHLFIGEAKDVSDLGAKGDYVLVHQLIRQYVTAKILLNLPQLDKTHSGKGIVPFLVVDAGKIDKMKNTEQVKFMCEQGWLKEKNILSWDKIALLR